MKQQIRQQIVLVFMSVLLIVQISPLSILAESSSDTEITNVTTDEDTSNTEEAPTEDAAPVPSDEVVTEEEETSPETSTESEEALEGEESTAAEGDEETSEEVAEQPAPVDETVEEVTVDPWEGHTASYFKVARADQPVYSEKNTNNPIGALKSGQVFPVSDSDAGWHTLTFGTTPGYVEMANTVPVEGAQVASFTAINTDGRTLTATTDAKVYDNSTGALVEFATLNEGEEAPILLDFGPNWWRVRIGGRIGYVNKSDVTVDFQANDDYFKVTEADVEVFDNRTGQLVHVGTLEKNQVYRRVRDYGNWHQIQFGDYYGYVLKRKTTVASADAIAKEATGNVQTERTLTASEDVVVYDNSTGRLIPFLTIKAGKEASIIRDYGNWWEIVISNRVGYVKKSQVTTSFKTTDRFFEVLEEDTKVYDNRSGGLVEVAMLEAGETYERVRDYGNWHQIRFDDYYGYVLKRKTTPGSGRMIPARTNDQPINQRSYTVLEDTIVYDNSKGYLDPFMTLTPGTKARIDRDYGNWWQVIVGERIGYIKKSQVQVDFKTTDKYFRVLDEDVTIYDNRSGALKKVGTLAAGEEYRRVSDYGNWHQIQFNNYFGYVKEAETTLTYGANITNESSKITNLNDQTTFSSAVNILDAPSNGATVLGTVDKGVSYEVVEHNSSWYKVLFSNRIGYINKSASGIQTEYDLSLSEMTDIQMTRRPQTDKYRNEAGYIHASLINITERSVISGDGVALRTEPSTLSGNQTVFARVNSGTTVDVLGTVTGTSVGGDTSWYKISFEGKTLYVHASLVSTESKAAKMNRTANVRAGASTSAHIYGTQSQGTTVNVLGKVTGTTVNGDSTWYKVSYSTWRLPTKSDLLVYLDPDKQDPFQFLLLSEPANVSTAQLNRILSGKGILDNQGASFIEAGKKYGVNEIYLIAHALLESGQGNSALARGVEVGRNSSGKATVVTSSNRGSLTNIKRVYNMYGIGAYDNVALVAGATYAYNNGWTSPEIAVIEGARFVSNNYFSRGQTTLYKMRWNPDAPGTHQYATDIGWAAKQIHRMKQLYELIDNPSLKYDIPKFK